MLLRGGLGGVENSFDAFPRIPLGLNRSHAARDALRYGIVL